MIVLDCNSHVGNSLEKAKAYYRSTGYKDFPVTHFISNDKLVYSNPKADCIFVLVGGNFSKSTQIMVADLVREYVKAKDNPSFKSTDIVSTKDYHLYCEWDLGVISGNIPAFDQFNLVKSYILRLLNDLKTLPKIQTPEKVVEKKSTKQKDSNPDGN